MNQATLAISPNTLLKVKRKPTASLPVYSSSGAAGADLRACLEQEVTLEPGKRAVLPTGLYFEIPVGYEVQVRPRSGLAAKNGITVLNTPGTIDHDYRGEIQVIVINLGEEPFIITHGMRIAQMVVAPVTTAAFLEIDEIDDSTERGGSGFGSTGIH
jgi:dUTP pyrophosphatase